MTSNYIQALAKRHAEIERRIEEAQKAPAPDTLYITSLKKVRLAYRDRIREAIRGTWTRSDAARRRSGPPATEAVASRSQQLSRGH